TVTEPSSVGTFTRAPSAASAKVIGTFTVRFDFPARPNTGSCATCTTTKRSPGSPPYCPGAPRPATLIRCPPWTPAGVFTLTSRGRSSTPRPLQCLHLSLTIAPRPPHCGQTCEKENGPWSTSTSPVPPHVGHVSGDVPGLAPVPWQTWHTASPVRWTVVVTPCTA